MPSCFELKLSCSGCVADGWKIKCSIYKGNLNRRIGLKVYKFDKIIPGTNISLEITSVLIFKNLRIRCWLHKERKVFIFIEYCFLSDY